MKIKNLPQMMICQMKVERMKHEMDEWDCNYHYWSHCKYYAEKYFVLLGYHRMWHAHELDEANGGYDELNKYANC